MASPSQPRPCRAAAGRPRWQPPEAVEEAGPGVSQASLPLGLETASPRCPSAPLGWLSGGDVRPGETPGGWD